MYSNIPKLLHDGVTLQPFNMCEVTKQHLSVPRLLVEQYPSPLHTHFHECPVAIHLMCSLQEVASICPHGCTLFSYYGSTWARKQKDEKI